MRPLNNDSGGNDDDGDDDDDNETRKFSFLFNESQRSRSERICLRQLFPTSTKSVSSGKPRVN